MLWLVFNFTICPQPHHATIGLAYGGALLVLQVEYRSQVVTSGCFGLIALG
jgi:hypothetical protein